MYNIYNICNAIFKLHLQYYITNCIVFHYAALYITLFTINKFAIMFFLRITTISNIRTVGIYV